MMHKRALACATTLALFAWGSTAFAQSLPEAIAAGKPILEIRPRYEGVDQANLARDADAFTVRTRLGWETGAWNDVKGLIEFEDVRGSGDYNSTLNRQTLYPVVADPEVTELNRLQLSWTPNKMFTGTLGRQRVILDDQRFIGSVAWRQDEQTFDAVRGDVQMGKLKVVGVYIAEVNRTVAQEADWDSESWLVNAAVQIGPALTPQVFVYALDFDNARANSSITWGMRGVGSVKAGDVGLAYSATYAKQSEHGNNPGDFDLGYWQADLAATYGMATVKVAYESLEGDGRRGFTTPLATLHAFQGWADVFVATPANGVEDANLSLVVKPKVARLPKLELVARYHSFEAERGGADLGEELDLSASFAVTKRVTALLKYADYDGVAGFSSRRKLWFSLEFKL